MLYQQTEALSRGLRYKQIDIQIGFALGGKEAIGDFVVEGWNSSSLKKVIREEVRPKERKTQDFD